MRRIAPYPVCLLILACSTASFADTPDGTLARIVQTKTITLGYRASDPPFSYADKDGAPIGYSVDLCLRIVDGVKRHLGLDDIKVNYVVATSATRFVLLKNKTIDIECGATTNTAERRKIADFSYPHFVTATQFVSRRDDHITHIRDLMGRSVASTTGTVDIDQLNTVNRSQNLNIAVIPSRTNEESFALFTSGRAAAFVMDGVLLAGMIAETPDPTVYTLSDDTLSEPDPYGLTLRLGDLEFKTVVNATLRDVFVSGEIEAIYAKWFTSPIPPKGANLNLPMSPALEAVFRNPTEYDK